MGATLGGGTNKVRQNGVCELGKEPSGWGVGVGGLEQGGCTSVGLRCDSGLDRHAGCYAVSGSASECEQPKHYKTVCLYDLVPRSLSHASFFTV